MNKNDVMLKTKNNNDVPLPKNDTNHRKWFYDNERKIMTFFCLKKWHKQRITENDVMLNKE